MLAGCGVNRLLPRQPGIAVLDGLLADWSGLIE